ncbi:MAG: phospholipid carrier-dependent glycosyltransferase [Polyangiales bacterium]
MTAAHARLARLAAPGLWALAFAATAVMAPRTPVYWDSFGYLGQSVTGLVGGLALGRPHFVYTSHAVANVLRALGVSVWSLGAWLTVLWAMVSALCAPLTRATLLAAGQAPRDALWAGVAVALSPALAHTAGAVLTDGPSLAVSLLAFVVALRGAATSRPARWALLAGALVGVAAGMREQAAAQGLVTLLAFRGVTPRDRWRCALALAVGFALGFAPPVLWAATHQVGYRAMLETWLRGMRQERGAHPYTLTDFAAFLRWLVALGPVTLVAAAAQWTRRPRALVTGPLLAVCAPSLLQLALLAGYQDISYSPRYLLSALPGALAIPAGLALARVATTARRQALLAAVMALPLLVAAPWLRAREAPLSRAVEGVPALLRTVPPDALVVAGQTCPAVELTRRLALAEPARWGAAPRWPRICPGWAWPDDLAARLDAALAQGQTVVLDLRPGAWLGPRQARVFAEVRAWSETRDHPRVIRWR